MTHASRARRALLLTLLACGGLAASADAATYCVAVPSCPGTTVGATSAAVQQALDLADASAEPDHVMIGPGTFDGGPTGYRYNSASPVDISGAGAATRLTMTPPNSGERILRLEGTGIVVRDLQVLLPNGNGGRGVHLDGATAERIEVASSPSTGEAIGVLLVADAVLRDADVTVTGPYARGVSVGSLATGSSWLVEDVRIVSDDQGIEFGPKPDNDPVPLRRVAVRAAGLALDVGRGRAHLAGSVLTSTGPTVVRVDGSVEGATTLTANHVTIAGTGGASQAGVHVATDVGDHAASATLADSIVTAVGRPLVRSAAGSAQALVSAERVAHPPLGAGDATGPGATTDVSPLPDAPAFVDAAAGDFRLGPASPLIDAGGPLSPDEPAVDLAGNPRTLDGNGDCAARPDVGAFEFAPASVVVRASAPATAAAGQPIAFSAAGTCDADPAATLTYTWSFDDGTIASGATVEHAFGAPGPHTATLSVAGGGGRTGTATATVTVTGTPAADRTAPRLSGLRRVKGARRPTLRFALDEPATVAVRIQRCRARRGACRPARRAVRATWAGKAGANRRALPKRIRRAGRYRVRLVAIDGAGNRGAARTIVVRVRTR